MPTYCGIPFCHSENSLGWASRQTRALLVTWAEPPTALSPWALISPLPGTKILVPARDTGGEWGWGSAASQSVPGHSVVIVSLVPFNRGWTWAGASGVGGCRRP